MSDGCHAVMIHRNNLYKVSLLTWSELHGKLWAQEPQANRDVWKLVWILNIFDKWEEHHDDNMSNWVLWYLRLPKSLGLPLEEKVDSKGKAAGEEICRTSEKVHWCQRAQKGVPNSVDPIWWPQCFCQMLTLPISFIRCVVTGLDHLMRCGNSKLWKDHKCIPRTMAKLFVLCTKNGRTFGERMLIFNLRFCPGYIFSLSIYFPADLVLVDSRRLRETSRCFEKRCIHLKLAWQPTIWGRCARLGWIWLNWSTWAPNPTDLVYSTCS